MGESFDPNHKLGGSTGHLRGVCPPTPVPHSALMINVFVMNKVSVKNSWDLRGFEQVTTEKCFFPAIVAKNDFSVLC